MELSEQASLSGNAFDLYLESNRFEFRPVHQLSRLQLFRGFLSLLEASILYSSSRIISSLSILNNVCSWFERNFCWEAQ